VDIIITQFVCRMKRGISSVRIFISSRAAEGNRALVVKTEDRIPGQAPDPLVNLVIALAGCSIQKGRTHRD
jgi:uncharacterized OsmC-like protein